jgi:hypothetical protein
MATTEIDINAPASAVYRTLMDAWTYEVWVKGTKNIREVDASWPKPGSRFHHSVGIGPLMTRDETRLLQAEPNRLVELNIQLWPVGEGVVRLELAETGARTHVTMHEEFTLGPAAWADNPLQQMAMKLRNDWSLDKLREVVEQRHGQSDWA